MHVQSMVVNITSEQPAELAAFYRDAVGLAPNPQIGETAFDAGGMAFLIDDLAAEQKRLEGQGVRFIRSAGREYWGGVISTFLDPDGNYCQLIEFKAEA